MATHYVTLASWIDDYKKAIHSVLSFEMMYNNYDLAQKVGLNLLSNVMSKAISSSNISGNGTNSLFTCNLSMLSGSLCSSGSQ